MIACPVCEVEIDVEEDELDEGDPITCNECGADLKVVSVDPLELEPLEEDEDEEEADLDGDEDEDLPK
jgi:alpha-aminoadipate carrier protein LysW